MKHFNESLWADFVRGVVSTTLRAEMELHLRSGCSSCQAAVDWLHMVETVAAADRRVEIPQDWIARALEVFPHGETRNNWIEDLAITMAELIFQTGPGWQPVAGVRASAGTTTQPGSGRMVYRAGEYRIDVSVEAPSTSEPGEIVGQISSESNPDQRLEGLVVQAAAQSGSCRLLSETTANRFGEFVMEYPFLEKANLRIASRELGLRIEFPLPIGRPLGSGGTK